MPQELDPVDEWEFERETVELIPLTIETYSASAGWSATSNYTVACVPNGTRPASANFATPTSDGGLSGYLVNGPVLGVGRFVGYYRVDGNTQDPVKKAFTLTLT